MKKNRKSTPAEPEIWTILKTPYRPKDLDDELFDRAVEECAAAIDREIIGQLMKLTKKYAN